jgi:hypothetical protein
MDYVLWIGCGFFSGVCFAKEKFILAFGLMFVSV